LILDGPRGGCIAHVRRVDPADHEIQKQPLLLRVYAGTAHVGKVLAHEVLVRRGALHADDHALEMPCELIERASAAVVRVPEVDNLWRLLVNNGTPLARHEISRGREVRQAEVDDLAP